MKIICMFGHTIDIELRTIPLATLWTLELGTIPHTRLMSNKKK